MADKNFTFLMAEQSTITRLIHRNIENFNKMGREKQTKRVIEARLENLRGYWGRCLTTHSQLEAVASEAEREHDYFKEDWFTDAANSFDEACDYYNGLLENYARVPVQPSSASTFDQPAGYSLPSINLPQFSGNLTDWWHFQDMFNSLVHTNPRLTDVQKLHYLRSSLTGDAAALLKNTAITAVNYQPAWELVKKRHENIRFTVNAHLETFVDLPNVAPSSILSGLKLIHNTSIDIYTALSNLQRPIELWEDLFVYLIVRKLDKTSLAEWQAKLGSQSEMPTFKQLDDFLTTRLHTLVALQSHTDTRAKTKSFSSHQVAVSAKTCLRCNGKHPLYLCTVFKKDSAQARKSFALSKHLCFNCLKEGHLPPRCASKYRCSICDMKHHSLLHLKMPIGPDQTTDDIASNELTVEQPRSSITVDDQAVLNAVQTKKPASSCLLPTALVRLRSHNGRTVLVRALLDQGSQVSCVTTRVIKLLKPSTKKVSINITGVGGHKHDTATREVVLEMLPVTTLKPVVPFSAIVLSVLTSYTPGFRIPDESWSRFQRLPLADSRPQNLKIDLLLGAAECAQVLLSGIQRNPSERFLAQNTIFGWVIFGSLAEPPAPLGAVQVNHVLRDEDCLQSLNKFWELEEVPITIPLSEEDARCEDHFKKTHFRRKDGRYVVSLPFKQPIPIPIGQTAKLAQKLFFRRENTLKQSAVLFNEYQSFLREYLDLGHMERVTQLSTSNTQNVFIPHFPVLRQASQTTKLRVVFNASFPSSNGTTLNDFLHVGPKLLKDLSALLLLWRSYRLVYTADIEKMFRQILIHSLDTNYQLIWWRPRPNDSLESYRLKTITYGTACAPYLANRVLLQLADDEVERFPLGASIVRQNFYVDDVLFGSDDPSSLAHLKQELTLLLKAGGFRLRKWASNSPDLLRDISREDYGVALEKQFSRDDRLSILGVKWTPLDDSFTYSSSCSTQTVPMFTKRKFLSLLASVYDPLGWAAPFIISGKIIVQALWLEAIGWDDTISPSLQTRCLNFQTDLQQINHLRIPRWVGLTSTSQNLVIHGFADASTSAYAAVVYLSVLDCDSNVKISLLCAKTKVAPLKLQSVPRLELCALVLLAKLLTFVRLTLKLDSVPIIVWTDSQTALHWVNSCPSRWKPYVAHRTTFIRSSLPDAQWRYVPGVENPADCASRGVSIELLADHKLWWHGPSWLQSPSGNWPLSPTIVCNPLTGEEKNFIHVVHTTITEWTLLSRFSSWTKLLRVTTYILRFLRHCRHPNSRSQAEIDLTSNELSRTTNVLLQHVQLVHFLKELTAIKTAKPLPPKSSIIALTPYIGDHDLLRVGGRISSALLPENTKHPIIIPKCPFAELLIRHYHVRTLHGGVQLTLRVLREQYWVVSARSLARKIVRSCVVCTRTRAALGQQIMADLPAVRVRRSRPFQHTGVDYAGPFSFKITAGRGRKTMRGYIAVFVCLCVRAIHLEIVSDYSTPAFLAALDRFVSRRGLPQSLYSDNGTTFQGADKALAKDFERAVNDPAVKARLTNDHIQWHFIPPYTPHFGGIWEAGVKSVKHHLKRILGAFNPTFEELQTLLCKIEATLNSRPLSPLNDDPTSYDALTPGHFLVGSVLISPPQPSLLEHNPKYLSRWQALQAMHERFWRVWHMDYLNALQLRTKWREISTNLQPNDLVLVKNPTLPPSRWLLARVVQVFLGEDDRVRVVKVRTATSEFTRGIASLCKLPVA